MKFDINTSGNEFLRKMKKDTISSIFVFITGTILSFWLFISSFGFNLMGISGSLLTTIINGYFFIYSPIILRGQWLNTMIISFEINGNLFTYKTAEFMLSSSKTVSGELSDLKRAQGDGNYAKYDEKISLRYKDGQNPVVYVIKDYFDNYDTLVGLLGKEEN